eukprot:g888.t1
MLAGNSKARADLNAACVSVGCAKRKYPRCFVAKTWKALFMFGMLIAAVGFGLIFTEDGCDAYYGNTNYHNDDTNNHNNHNDYHDDDHHHDGSCIIVKDRQAARPSRRGETLANNDDVSRGRTFEALEDWPGIDCDFAQCNINCDSEEDSDSDAERGGIDDSDSDDGGGDSESLSKSAKVVWWAKDQGAWKPKSKWIINMCDFVNKSGSNVTYQRALDAQAPKKLHCPLSPARSQPSKEPGSPPPRPVKEKQAPRKRKLSLNAWLAEREEPASPPKKMRARAASRQQ